MQPSDMRETRETGATAVSPEPAGAPCATPEATPRVTASQVRKSLLKNASLIGVARLLTALAFGLSTPVILAKLGAAGLGVWETLFATSILFAFLNGVLTTSFLCLMSQAFGREDKDEMRRFVRIGVLVYLLILAVMVPIVWLVSIPLTDAFKFPEAMRSIAQAMLPMTVGVFIISGMGDMIGTVTGGSQRTGITMAIKSLASVVQYVVAVICLLLGMQLYSMLIGFASGIAFSFTWYSLMARKHLGPGFTLFPAIPSRDELKKLRGYSAPLTVSQIGFLFREQADKIVLGLMASSSLVGYYGIASRLNTLIVEGFRLVSTPTMSAAGMMHAQKNAEGIETIYRNMMLILQVVVGMVLVVIAGFYDRILIAWLGSNVHEIGLLLVLLMGGYSFSIMLTGTGVLIARGVGRVGVETRYVLVNITLNVVLTLILIFTPLGALGKVVASAVAWALASFYFAYLAVTMLGLPRTPAIQSCIALGSVAVTVVGFRLVLPYVPMPTGRVESLLQLAVGGLLAGAIYLSLLVTTKVLPVRVLRQGLQRLAARLPRKGSKVYERFASASRRLRWRVVIGGAVLLLLVYATCIEPVWVQTTRHRIVIADLPATFENFTIVHLTDWHYPGLSDAYFRRVVRLANAEQPDLIVFTGDYLPGGTKHLPRFLGLVTQLRARHGIVAVLGNHDHHQREALVPALREAGVMVLENAAHPIVQDDRRLWMVGVEDCLCGEPDIALACRDVPRNEPAVLLAHEPDYADTASRHGIALQLSGHSHGGQVCLPFIGPLYTPYGSRQYPAGLYDVDGTQVYTSRGVGGLALLGIQVRIFCRPEMPVLTLTRKK